MPESEDLLKAAQESLEAARLLASRGFHPDAVSRAYYAIVYAARAALASRGVAAKTHGGTLQRFGELFVAPGLLPSDLTTSFGKAMAIRNRARLLDRGASRQGRLGGRARGRRAVCRCRPGVPLQEMMAGIRGWPQSS